MEKARSNKVPAAKSAGCWRRAGESISVAFRSAQVAVAFAERKARFFLHRSLIQKPQLETGHFFPIADKELAEQYVMSRCYKYT